MVRYTFMALSFMLAVSCIAMTGCPNPPASIKQARNLGRDWKPPTQPIDRDQFFLDQQGEFRLVKSEDCSELKEFDFKASGWHAVYEGEAGTIDFYLFRDVEKETMGRLYENSKKLIHGTGPYRGQHSAGMLDQKLNCPDGRIYRIFPKDNWIAVFKSEQPQDPIDFAESCLRGISNR